MASESAATDQRIDAQLLDEKKVVDDIKLDGEEIIFQPKETAGKDGVDNIKEGSSVTVSNATASDEKPETEDASDVQEPKKEEEHEKNGRKNSLLEPEVSVQESEPVISDTKTEDLKDDELPSTSEDEHKPEETPALSTDLEISKDKNVDAEIEAKANPEPSIDSVIELTNSEDTKNEVQEPVPAEISTTDTPDVSEAPEKDVVDPNAPTSIKETVKDLEVESGTPEERTQELSNAVVPNVSEVPEKVDDLNAPTSIEVPVKDLEVESGSPEEQKQEKTTEPQEPISNATSIAGVNEAVESSSYEEKASGDAKAVEKRDDSLEKERSELNLNAPTSIEVPVKDLEVESGSPEEQKQEKATEPQEPISNATSIAGVNEAVESSSYEEKASGDAKAVEKRDDSLEKERSELNLNAPTSIEVPVKDLEVESGSPEEQKQEKTTEPQEPISNATSIAGVNEAVESSSYEEKASGDAEAVEKRDDSLEKERSELNLNAPTSIEVPVKDLEVESGSPEEQKQEKTTEPQEPISNTTSIAGVNEAVESSSYEEKVSGDAEAVEKKDDSLEKERSETPVETHGDLEAKTEVPQTPSSEEVANKREDENVEGDIDTFADLDGSAPVALVSPEGKKASELVEVVKEKKDETLEGDNIDDTPKVAGASLEGEKTLEGDKVVDKEKVENEEAVAEVSSEQDKAVETAEIVNKEKDMGINIDKETLGATPKDFGIAPDATEVRSEGESVSAGDQENNESLKHENPTSVEAPKGFTTAEELPEQVIEEKEIKNSVSEKGSPANISRDFDPAEPSTEIVKVTGAPETVEEVKDETSEGLNVEEKDVKVPDRKEEVKVEEEAIQITTDTLENEDLGTEKQESEKTKDQDPIVSSNTGDAKLIKEVTKRESTNLFAKVKRSIVKAKKAILGKSPGPKNVSAEAKDVNS